MVSFNTSSGFLSTLGSLSRISYNISDLYNKFSSGKAVNTGRDSPVLLSRIGEFTASINGYGVANSNISSVNGVLNTANGGLTQMMTTLQDLRATAVQAADGTISSGARAALSTQAGDLMSSMDQLANGVNFNGETLLNGAYVNKSIQIGPNEGDTVNISLNDVRTSSLGIDSIDLSTQAGAGSALTAIDNAIGEVTNAMASVGSNMNRVDNIEAANQTSLENITAARSVIEDLDYSQGASLMVQNQIKQKAGIMVLKKILEVEKAKISLLV
ncbi:MAG: hypothetical protein HQM16_02120 [Deltaproteobacteria bacterium]|nr:hypothetical protein [Deltaproteobacteria bacterium]